MWKMQLLDEHHLFIKYTSEDVVTLRVTDPSQVGEHGDQREDIRRFGCVGTSRVLCVQYPNGYI